jgi:cytochrome c2
LIMVLRLRFIQIILLLILGLMLWVINMLLFFQHSFLPTSCGVRDEPVAVCGTSRIYGRQVALDSSASIGHALFEANCISCHSLGSDVVVGPGLKDIQERRDSIWIASFIRNSQKVIQSGDKYAADLFEKYNKAIMTSFNFTDAEIWAILRYIRVSRLP